MSVGSFIVPPTHLHAMCCRGPEEWLLLAGMVEGAKGGLQKIEPNILQRRALATWQSRYDAGKPARIVGLKPRKRGFSTISTACHYWLARRQAINIGLLGHQDNASTQTLFRMLETYRDTDRNALNWGNVPTKQATDEFRFSNGSTVVRLTAENPAKVRSQTLQAISATEWAFWKQSELALQAAMNAMPKGVFTSFIGESTPKGITGSFPTTWKNARWPTADECPGMELYWHQWLSFLPQQENTGIPEEELFIRIFAAWFEFDDAYVRLSPREAKHVQETLDAEDWYFGEQDLIDRYQQTRPSDGQEVLGKEVHGATVWEQLAWRRARIRTDCNNSRRSFDEEYPSDPHTCFLSSGHPYFDPESITTLDQITVHVPKAQTGILEWKEQVGAPPQCTWHETRSDAHIFHVWEHPKEGCAYLVTIDSATGENNVVDGDPDRHSILVLRQPYRSADGVVHLPKVVARVRPPCLVPLYTAAEWAAKLATYFQALVVPEINNTGQAIVMALRDWPHIRIFKRVSGQDPRTGRRQKKELIGHLTDEATRQIMLARLHQILRDEMLDVSCPHIIYELRIFNNDPNVGRPEAPEGEHDDDVMALAIGLFRLDNATPYVIPTRRRGDIRRDMPSMLGRVGAGEASAMHS
jgi:hypothetical protein